MENQETAKLLATRRNKKLENKLRIWKLVYDSYKGGEDYINSKNLFQYSIEDNLKYGKRLARADYANHTAQLVDMITGFVYALPVFRQVEDKYSYILDSIHKGKSLQSLMNMVATKSLMSTVGLLVDAPSISPGITQADRLNSNVNPYVVFYSPWDVCDFDHDDEGQLLWVLLNNSYMDNSDPYNEPVLKDTRRLWTRDYYRDVEVVQNKETNALTYVLGEEITHELGEVPFIFVNCKDNDEDFICDSVFEDVALKSRKIFNMSSWADEVLASSTFQVMTFPYETQEDFDNIVTIFDPQKGGMADIPVVPYKVGGSPPAFTGPDIDVDKFITLINYHTEEILAKFGLKKESSGVWESGVAKSIDFAKTESFLRSFSLQLEETEKKIIRLCSLYEGQEIKYDIQYSFNYEKQDIQKEFDRLTQLLLIPSDNVKKKVYKDMVQLSEPALTEEEVEELISDIAVYEESPPL